MFDKLKFNNLVISNKKGIRQSRTQTINKLVHKIRKLKTLFEKRPDNIKCKERIRKSTETMDILKKLTRVDMVKKVLLMDKPAAAIITNGTSIPEEIAVALLSMNKVMQNLIKKFKTELKINGLEGNDWKKILMESSKRKIKMERTEEKRRKRLELKQQKAVGRKRQEWLEENQPKIETDLLPAEADANITTVGDWCVEESSNKTAAKDEIDVENSSEELKRTIKKTPAIKKTSVPNKKPKILKVEVLDSTANDSQTLYPNKNEKEVENDDSLVVDPFFITATGENYLSTAINKQENNSEEETDEKRELHMIKLNKFGQKRLGFKESRNQKRVKNVNQWKSHDVQSKKDVNKDNRNGKFSRNKITDKNNGQLRQQDSYKKDSKNSNNEKMLHPSWAAKQKLKPIITEFKGKKTTFGEGLSTTHTYYENDLKNKNSAENKIKNSEKDSLHPSWVAKQKHKPCITTFQGKKITFENNE